jgi:hypothetical protein
VVISRNPFKKNCLTFTIVLYRTDTELTSLLHVRGLESGCSCPQRRGRIDTEPK